MRNLSENIVKYQNFKTSEMLRIIDNAGYSKVSLEAFINAGINYIHTGKKISKRGNLYKFIDDALNKHIQPLTPKVEQKRRAFITKEKKQKVEKTTYLPINKVMDNLNKKAIKNNCNFYAVKMGKNLRLHDTQEEAQAFMDGLSFMGATETKIVKLVIEEI